MQEQLSSLVIYVRHHFGFCENGCLKEASCWNEIWPRRAWITQKPTRMLSIVVIAVAIIKCRIEMKLSYQVDQYKFSVSCRSSFSTCSCILFFFGPLLLLLLFALMLMLYTVYIIFYLLFFEWTEMFFPSSSQEKKNCSHFQFTVVFSSFTKKREKIIAPLGHYCAETNCYNNTESSTLILKYFNEFAYFAFCYFALCFSNFIVGNAHLHSTHKTSDTTTKLKWMKQKPSSEWQWNMFFFE